MKANRVKVEDLLRKMKGKYFLYNTNQVKVLNFNFKGDVCSVATDGPWVEKPCDEMLLILEQEFLPVDGVNSDDDDNEPLPPVLPINRGVVAPPASIVPTVKPVPEIETVKEFKSLSSILMDNIRRVQDSQDYVDQAQQVTLSVRTFVDLAKVEIEAARLMQGQN